MQVHMTTKTQNPRAGCSFHWLIRAHGPCSCCGNSGTEFLLVWPIVRNTEFNDALAYNYRSSTCMGEEGFASTKITVGSPKFCIPVTPGWLPKGYKYPGSCHFLQCTWRGLEHLYIPLSRPVSCVLWANNWAVEWGPWHCDKVQALTTKGSDIMGIMVVPYNRTKMKQTLITCRISLFINTDNEF